ncbi:uncharacterized protein SAPINGB_P005065 [Magnusiomyces paraingens]|uniref:3-hydroxyanthranilate 3,4-dioxygenase n=1 Tax=Magnusiomyces paraingens TaxID=2606893 RepID=A0A5E8BZC1_9ASCO|nr:uncharacterized protein SAPINGB_P005065 [Saprochaete ingens]VVT56452.1 unnamed protein product [Saprochaete ingens]
MLPDPINLPKWIAENKHLLKPPVNNFCIHRGGFTVMIVGGPNERTDYHVNQTPEWFHQLQGHMTLKVVDEGKFRDIEIGEGEIFLLPPNTPHNPVRYENTIGLVVEQDRPTDLHDAIQWYCPECKELVYRKEFHMHDLGTQVKEAIEEFRSNEEARKCKKCGHVIN